MPRSAKLLAFPGSPLGVARRLRTLAREIERGGVVRFAHVALINTDSTMVLMEIGRASFVERVGLLDIARDSVLHPPGDE